MESTLSAIGIDVGGTWCRAGWVDSAGRLQQHTRIRTPPGDSKELLTWIAASIRAFDLEIAAKDPCQDNTTKSRTTVGLALPGLLDRSRGVLEKCINVPALERLRVVDAIKHATGRTAYLVTDSAAATWAEYTARASGKIGRFAHLRLGTGVAFGLVVDGLNVAIEESRQGHLELLVVDRSSQARKCPCGKRGCLETVASGRALQDQAGAADLGSDLAALGELEAGGHDGARKILTDAALALAKALENIQKECRPDVICLGGGVTEALPQLLPTIERHLSAFQRERTLGPLLRIEPARLGDTAGVVGAALLAKAGAITSN